MRKKELVNCGYLSSTNDKVLLGNYSYAFNLFKQFIENKMFQLNVEEIIIDSSLDLSTYISSLKEGGFFAWTNNSLKIVSKKESKTLLRNLILDIFDVFKSFFKDFLSIITIEGSIYKNDDYLVLSYVDEENVLKEILGAKIILDNGSYSFSIELNNNFLLDLLSSNYYDGILHLNTSIQRKKIVILPYKENEKGVRKKAVELQNILLENGIDSILDVENVPNKDKMEEYLRKGFSAFIEFGPKEIENFQFRLYFLNKEEYTLVDEEKFIKTLRRKLEKMNSALLNKSIEKLINKRKEYVNLCDNCIENRKDLRLLNPFSQSIIDDTCESCNKKVTRFYLRLAIKN